MAGDGEAREPRRAHVTRPTHRKEPKRERACVWMFNALVLSLSPFPIPPRHILERPLHRSLRVLNLLDASPSLSVFRTATLSSLMDPYTFGGKYRLEEEIAIGGCGTHNPPLSRFHS